MPSRRLLSVLAGLAAVRVAIPLAVIAAEGTKLPGLPEYRWRGLEGDANGYYAGAREALAAARTPAAAVAALAALLLGVGGAVVLRRRGRGAWIQLLAAGAGVAGAATAVAASMHASGTPVVGWPLVWSIPLAPLRVAAEPGIDAAWTVGVALSLAFVAATTVACGLLGRWATDSDAVAVGGAALFAGWPVLSGTLAGEQAWENGTWLVDVGLHLYTEPLSTCLVTMALALLVRRPSGDGSHAAAGLLLGFATAVKLTNGLIAIALAPLVLWRRGARTAAVYAGGGLVFAPLVAVYWNKGYVGTYGGAISESERPWSLDYASVNWTDSLLFTPTVLALLAPLFVAGCLAVGDRRVLTLLLTPVAVTFGVYSFYDFTATHPRFLFVAVPSVFVLEAAGAVAVGRRLVPPRPLDALRRGW